MSNLTGIAASMVCDVKGHVSSRDQVNPLQTSSSLEDCN